MKFSRQDINYGCINQDYFWTHVEPKYGNDMFTRMGKQFT